MYLLFTLWYITTSDYCNWSNNVLSNKTIRSVIVWIVIGRRQGDKYNRSFNSRFQLKQYWQETKIDEIIDIPIIRCLINNAGSSNTSFLVASLLNTKKKRTTTVTISQSTQSQINITKKTLARKDAKVHEGCFKGDNDRSETVEWIVWFLSIMNVL